MPKNQCKTSVFLHFNQVDLQFTLFLTDLTYFGGYSNQIENTFYKFTYYSMVFTIQNKFSSKIVVFFTLKVQQIHMENFNFIQKFNKNQDFQAIFHHDNLFEWRSNLFH